jgi:hypothetical protein
VRNIGRIVLIVCCFSLVMLLHLFFRTFHMSEGFTKSCLKALDKIEHQVQLALKMNEIERSIESLD